MKIRKSVGRVLDFEIIEKTRKDFGLGGEKGWNWWFDNDSRSGSKIFWTKARLQPLKTKTFYTSKWIRKLPNNSNFLNNLYFL